MQITANEIAAIEEAGAIDGAPVKMIRTKGGFWIAVGRPAGKLREEALAAGSHPAIVKHNLSKMFPTFQEAMMKSEAFAGNDAQVESHSHFLSDELRKSGHEIFSVQAGPDIAFHITRLGALVGLVKSHKQEKSVVITEVNAPEQFKRALAGATSEKALSLGAKTLKFEVK